MSILDGAESRVLTNFSGPNLLLDEEDIKDPQGIFAQDVEYISGQVRTRRGFAAVGAWLSGDNRTLYNWLSLQFNRLVLFGYSAGNNIVSYTDLNSHANTPLLVMSGMLSLGISCAQAGYRLYWAYFGNSTNALPSGQSEGRVWDGTTISSTPQVEKLFPRPILGSEVNMTMGSIGAGIVPPGTRLAGFLVQSWNGAQGPPSPCNSGNTSIFAGLQFNPSASPSSFVITITPTTTWPNWVNTIQLIMSPSGQYDKLYMVPGAVATVSRGTSTAVAFTVNLTDVTLAGTGTDVVKAGYFALLRQDFNGNGPFNVRHVVAYNTRMVYVADDLGPDGTSTVSTLFISNMNQPQWATRIYHQLYLPEFKAISTAQVIGSVLLVFGPQWTFAFSDNTQYPIQWLAPRTVSNTIGTPFVYGACPNPTRGYVWVADSSGLYYLTGGVYPELPASYYQTPDWLQINFSAPPDALKVVEDPNRRLVFVICPFGFGYQIANVIMVWDYTEGTTPGKIKYCGKWHIKGIAGDAISGNYTIGGAAMVYSPTNKNKELWIARGFTGTTDPALRQMYAPADAASTEDPALYNDNSVGIPWVYEHGPEFGVSDGPDQYLATSYRVRGNGTLHSSVKSLDGSSSTSLSDITLSSAPGKWGPIRWINKQAEALSIRFSGTGAAGNFFILSAIKTWRTKWTQFRTG